MPLPLPLQRLTLPVIAAPMFIVSTPGLLLEQCKAGVVGSLPAHNARPAGRLDEWLHEITETLAAWDRAHPQCPAAPFAVNLSVHKSNDRVEQDLGTLVKYRVPVVITTLGSRPEVNQAIHGYGGMVLHDVIANGFARKAIERGADGLIAVAAGAGGHGGAKSPFALVQEIRQWFDGPLVLGGAIATGSAVLAAQVIGADLAYVGSAFIATHEAQASDAYKQMIVDGSSDDIVYTSHFTGVHGNYLKPSIRATGLDPDHLPADGGRLAFGSDRKVWKDIWSSGQGIGAVTGITGAGALVERLGHEYREARQRLAVLGSAA